VLNQIRFEEQILVNRHADFPARYIAACNLRALAARHPHGVTGETIANLEGLMHDPCLLRHRRSFFLFREAVGAMTALARNLDPSVSPGHQVLAALRRLLRATSGHAHRACAEAVGSLPVAVNPPVLRQSLSPSAIPSVSLRKIAAACDGLIREDTPFTGRSLLFPCAGAEKLLVIKFARRDDAPQLLFRETDWMLHLGRHAAQLPVRFNVPEPLHLHGSPVFRLQDLPGSPPPRPELHPEHLAIAFTIPADYFFYANEPQHYPQSDQIREVMTRNSRLFGFFAARGIIHTAPIPLFHNRVQRHRREDHGLYDWPRGGRLDQWLASCRHPNFGGTGLRDFEHFQHIAGHGARLYWHIGTHILSLLLVTASYFRNRRQDLRGLDPDRKPVDARHLFDEDFLAELIRDTMQSYYQGFAGFAYQGELPFDLRRLTRRMIEETGVDRHMEEVLRQIDQQQMSDSEFKLFLGQRGFPAQKAAMTPKGVKDIVLHTGPHLGGFNQSISLPELIEATAAMAATCVLDRFAGGQQP
jgi:hypothetical protein